MSHVLVLNQNYEPLTTARLLRAVVLIGNGKAEVVQHGVLPIVTPSRSLPRPSVIRLVNMIKRPRPRVRFTRREVFKRDGFVCQYCGKRPRDADLTIDHVIPLSRGGRDWWDNVLTACRACNHKKGARTPEEARMPPRSKPHEPKLAGYLHLLGIEPEWEPFLPAVA